LPMGLLGIQMEMFVKQNDRYTCSYLWGLGIVFFNSKGISF
jgi:hypothetical protein